MFLHIDMDAFFASIEQAVNPRLKGRPLIVGSRAKKYHTVVCAASYEAKVLGIDSGMSTKEAFRLCPNAEFVPADSARYIFTSERIFQLLEDFGPNLEYLSVDEFLLSLDGLDNVSGSHERIAHKIKQAIKEAFFITCSIGIAPTRILAKLASKLNKPDGLKIITPNDLPGLFKSMPVEALCGIGPSLKQRLNLIGILSLEDLFEAPRDLLIRRFGKLGYWLYESVRTNKDLPVEPADSPDAPPKSIGHSYTLPRATANKEAIFAWIRLLSEMVSQRLREQNLEAKTIHLYLVGPDINRGFSKQKTFDQPTFDGYELYKRCIGIINHNQGIDLRVRAIGVNSSNFRPSESLFLLDEDKKRFRLLRAIDEINNKAGEWSIFPASIKLASKIKSK
ncbi:MAG: DNA polymerase IV [Candidatus Omnitrophota bacterium]